MKKRSTSQNLQRRKTAHKKSNRATMISSKKKANLKYQTIIRSTEAMKKPTLMMMTTRTRSRTERMKIFRMTSVSQNKVHKISQMTSVSTSLTTMMIPRKENVNFLAMISILL